MSKYMKNSYRFGTIATIIAMAVMLGIPAIISTYFGIWPDLNSVFKVAGSLLALYVPIAVSEQLSLVPITGTTAYLNSITGNVMNIKFPCYLSALETAEAQPGTELADVMGMIAVTVSGMVTMVVIALGVLLLVPLEPVLTSEPVRVATSYILPALYGSMGISAFISRSAGAYSVPRKPLIAIINLVLVFAFIMVVGPIKNTGIAMIIMLVFSMLMSYALYKANIIKMEKEEK
ncbi:MAG: hypothetical protein Q4E36_00090 [Bacillota bacterium]|nr:hypothetical protein [Bacillota bacterium]